MSDDSKMFGDTDDAALFGDAPKKKSHVAPKSFGADDQALGLETGASERLGTFEPGFPGATMRPVGAESKRLDAIKTDEAGRALMAEMAGQVVGSAVVPIGEGIGAPIGRKIVSSLSKLGAKGAEAAKGVLPATIDYIGRAIEHSQHELGKLGVARAVGQDVLELGKKAGATGASVVGGAAPGVAAGAGAAAGAAVAPSRRDYSAPEAPEFPEGTTGPQSSLHNAVDRLRASAATNPRAADLVARMAALQNAGTGAVTQSTLGAA